MAMETSHEPRPKRPDTIDLIGPEFDSTSSETAHRTLIICAAPRTGSYELCRYLVAAGIGVPHEYFHFNYSRLLGERWTMTGHPLQETQLGRYIELLRCRRAQNGIFATKLQYAQFERYLRNLHGASLFDGACVVHLFRPDVVGQYASYRAAITSGVWDFSQRQTNQPVLRDPTNFDNFFAEALGELTALISEDAGFRGLFILLGIRPIFVTTDELLSRPQKVIHHIANAVGAIVDEKSLETAIACSAAYERDRTYEAAVSGLVEPFRKFAFGQLRTANR